MDLGPQGIADDMPEPDTIDEATIYMLIQLADDVSRWPWDNGVDRGVSNAQAQADEAIASIPKAMLATVRRGSMP